MSLKMFTHEEKELYGHFQKKKKIKTYFRSNLHYIYFFSAV